MINNKTILFYSQLAISISGLIFTGSLLISQENNSNIYLPIFTSLIFAWVPSPLSFDNSIIEQNIKILEDRINIIESASLGLKEVKIIKDPEDSISLNI